MGRPFRDDVLSPEFPMDFIRASLQSSLEDIPIGESIAYVPMSDGSVQYGTTFEQVLHHEAIGHGFGKLGDEYAYSSKGRIPDNERENLIYKQTHGLYRNVDVHPQVSDTYWAHLAADPHYAVEEFRAYQG